MAEYEFQRSKVGALFVYRSELQSGTKDQEVKVVFLEMSFAI
jgi:hypothetical protein